MKLNLKTKTLALLVLFGLSFGFAMVQPDVAQAVRPNTNEACTAIGGCGGSQDDLQNTVTRIVNIFSVIIGIAAVIMIIVGGFKYITSGGDSSKTASAKHTIIYAIIGLIIVAFAQVIVNFVLTNV